MESKPSSYFQQWAAAVGIVVASVIILAVEFCNPKPAPLPEPDDQSTYSREKKLRGELTEMVGAKWDRPQGTVVEIAIRFHQQSSLERLAEFASVTKASLDYGRLKQVDLAPFKALANLKHLSVVGEEIGDDDLRRLSELPQVERLELYAPQVTVGGLAHLAKTSRLKDLVLYDTPRNGKSPELALRPDFNVVIWRASADAEKWVGDRIREDKVADLRDAAYRANPSDADRVISASFLLKHLLAAADDQSPRRRRIDIRNAIVIGHLDLESRDVPSAVTFIDCDFKQEVNAANARFAKHLIFYRCDLWRMNFGGARVEGALLAQETRFLGLERANFNGTSVGSNVNLSGSEFHARADFVGTQVGDQFQAVGTRFQHGEESASFNHMSAKGGVFVRDAVFEGPADFVTLEAQNAKFRGIAKPSGTSERVSFDSMKIAGSAFFDGVKFEGSVSFAHASVGSLYLEGAEWPGDAHPVRFDGTGFGSIRAGAADSVEPLIALAKRADFDRSFYLRLETDLRQRGRQEDADAVYIAMRRRDREKLAADGCATLHVVMWNLFLDGFVGFGRRPLRAAGLLIAFAIANWLVFFRRGGMEPVKPDDANRKYYGFWYVMDVLLPVIKLGVGDAWRPKAERRIANRYLFALKVLGWIVVGSGLLAVTGIIN